MNGYLTKPFKKGDLEQMLIQHIPEHINLIEKPKSADKENIVTSIAQMNIAGLIDEVGDNDEMIKHVLFLFKDEVRVFEEAMSKAVKDKDLEKIGQIAHRIKPNFQLFQLNQLVNILNKIEQMVEKEEKPNLIYENCHEVLKCIPLIQLQIAQELLVVR